MAKITVRTVQALKAGPNDVFTWDSGDGSLKGFGIRMKPSGSASYLVQYRNKEGRTRRLALAKVGTVTPDEARGLARTRLAEASKGSDPSADRKALRRSMTIAELCDAYLDHAATRPDKPVKASTLAMDKSRIERHVKPLIGSRRVTALTDDDVRKMQADIVAGRSAGKKPKGRGGRTTGGKGVAARTTGMLGTILQFAVKKKIVTANVVRGIERPSEGKQRRFLKLEEIGHLGVAMREAIDEGENRTGVAAIRFLLLSGCRRMEALTLKREIVDQGNGCIHFEDTKSGAQVRPIGTAALSAIKSPARSGYVFPADRGDGHFIGLPRVLARVCGRANLAGVTVHVLRHTFAATAASMGYSELTIAGLLGHTVSGVTARYAHVPDNALVSAANRVSQTITDALDGRADADNVVRLEARA